MLSIYVKDGISVVMVSLHTTD